MDYGNGGVGGEQPLLYSKGLHLRCSGVYPQNKQEPFSSSTAGDKGGSGFAQFGGAGGSYVAPGVFRRYYRVRRQRSDRSWRTW